MFLYHTFRITAFFHLFNIRRIRESLSMECTKILVNVFVSGLPNNQLYTLQRMQNTAARLI